MVGVKSDIGLKLEKSIFCIFLFFAQNSVIYRETFINFVIFRISTSKYVEWYVKNTVLSRKCFYRFFNFCRFKPVFRPILCQKQLNTHISLHIRYQHIKTRRMAYKKWYIVKKVIFSIFVDEFFLYTFLMSVKKYPKSSLHS